MTPPRDRLVVVHLTTTDMSLDWLLGPQLQAIQAAGYEVVAMSAPGPHVAVLTHNGIRHVAIPQLSRRSNPIADLGASAALYRALRLERPDVLHTHNPKPGVIGRIVGRLARVPVIVNTQHGLYAQPGDRWRRRYPVYLMERVAAAFGHHELVQNPEDARTLTNRLKVPPRKVTILGNGIDLLRFNGDRQQRVAVRAEWGFGDHHFVVGVVGRLVREKGFDEVVIAAELLHSTSPHIRLVVIGPDDPDKSDGVTAASISDAKSRGVHFVGQRDDMPACYAAMDLYVTASHREGFPRAAMEAAASGLPIVATDIRGCRQVVDHGVTGVLVPARDPAALASAVASLARDPAALARMGAAGAAKAATEFDQQGVIDVTLRTYQRLLTARGYSVSPLN